jgi:hypothetical protein
VDCFSAEGMWFRLIRSSTSCMTWRLMTLVFIEKINLGLYNKKKEANQKGNKESGNVMRVKKQKADSLRAM